MDNYNGPQMKIEILDHIFMADKGIIKILLLKKQTEPYKGYWSLPRDILSNQYNVLEEATEIAFSLTGIYGLEFFTHGVFSDIDRCAEERIVGIACIALTDSVTVSLNQQSSYECGWFDINNLPKLLGDHAKIAMETIADLKNILNDFNLVKKLFPSDFTLPELQHIFEHLEKKELDRRNFRKKLMTLDVIAETGESTVKESGRPAKLYRFKEK